MLASLFFFVPVAKELNLIPDVSWQQQTPQSAYLNANTLYVQSANGKQHKLPCSLVATGGLECVLEEEHAHAQTPQLAHIDPTRSQTRLYTPASTYSITLRQ